VFLWPLRHALRTRRDGQRQPWWAPPDRLDLRAAQVLGLLATLSVVGGYLGTLITQTITYAADEFHTSDAGQGATLASVRVGAFIALALVAAADRRGRRALLIATTAGGVIVTATGALVPNLVGLGISQTVARGLSAALGLLIAVVAAEEMPAGSRAYAISLLAMAAALGAGFCVMALPLADLGSRGWRLLYVLPLLSLPLIHRIARRMPESRRFERRHGDASAAGHGRRFWLLADAGFLLAVVANPASQFQNEYLRTERHFSAARISLFVIATNTPGGLGVVIGGRLADVRGRRIVASVAVLVGTMATVAMYLVSGWGLWFWSVLGAVIGSATIPALLVYGPELFPTTLRGRANGGISLVTVGGTVLGLLSAGLLSDRLGSFGPAMAILSVGPALLAVLILAAFPETAHVELEELNPEDR
jgi:MFS family permease